MNFDVNRLYFSTDGRIGRQQFWIGVVGLAVAGIVITIIASVIAGGMMTRGGQIATFIIQLIFAYPSYCLMAKRFQDRDKPSLYAAIVIGINLIISLLIVLGLTGDPTSPNALSMIFGLISLAIGIWIIVELGILRGTVGPNQYGPDPVA
jgi:uncharacterized membrane protein YhaH (DUF805 family)